MDTEYDVAVIGAGPGGYVAAIRAAQLGLKACVIEKDRPGGVCLNVGCIPSKSLIHAAGLVGDAEGLRALGAVVDLSGLDYSRAFAASRKAAERLSKGVQFLLKKNGVDYRTGAARFASAREVSIEGSEPIRAKAFIIATGSRPRELPAFPFDEKAVLTSTGALMLKAVPKRAVILGAGAIGMELGYVWNMFGSDVTIVEAMDRILPIEDADAAAVVRKAFEARGVRFVTGALATGMERSGDGLRVLLQTAGNREPLSPLEADALLVAVGRVPNSSGLGLEELGVRVERGFIEVGDFYETSAAGVYAIGDVVATPLLAHVASKEGEISAERIASLVKGSKPPVERRVDLSTVPSAVYCDPELASFGLSAEKAAATGVAHAVYSFPYRGVGKAVAVEKPEGFAKIVHDPATGEILGAVVVGDRATDVIHELLLARKAELTVDDVADMMHAHPTIAEAVMEAAKGSLGRAVHA
ncbi:MAG: dihydrolipoyl dehydrogenase [Spirochaetae bacterium HGW-Spirochaetae-3]|jgi:dihydrolipoamide dehydrogenase|nr:MAG: dihydrolipoyl dehydrogenase [Spirochaetae bacterium HGW-Spirochaetae-3]